MPQAIVSASGLKAIILDGDDVRQCTDFAELAAAHAAGKRFWVELDERTPQAEKFMDEILKIHPLAAEDVWNDIGIPKVEDFGDYVQLVMHGLTEEDKRGGDAPLVLTELDVIIGRHYVLTHAHDERACGVQAVQTEVLRNPRILKKGPAWVAHALLDRMVDEYLPVVSRFDAQMEAIEEKILKGSLKSDRATIARILTLKKSLQVLRRTTIAQREILLRLSHAEFDEIPRDALPFYRDVYDHFARVTELVDSYREMAAGLLQAHFSMQSQRMNDIMKRLTLISTLMLPLSLVAGIYGMNFRKNFHELDWEYGYYYALVLMAVIAAGILLWFKRMKWL